MRYISRAGIKNVKCPNCNGKNIIKYGKSGSKQVFYCNNCRKKFTERVLKNKTYSPQVISSAITYYNLGNTLEESVKLINRRFKVKVSKSSINSWVKEFSSICTYGKLRPKIVRKYKDKIVFAFSFQHSGLTYNFKYHLAKLEILCSGYSPLIQFLKDMVTRCPSDVFRNGERCSQLQIDVKIKKEGVYNQACKLAEFALKACRRNTERHDMVETFMLINDSGTIACEVPIWFWEKNLNIGICGHIDILQIRRGKIFILDFKPGADKEKIGKVASQLYLYASGLSFRTGIPLKVFRCGWFDEHVYYEFNPIESIVKMPR